MPHGAATAHICALSQAGIAPSCRQAARGCDCLRLRATAHIRALSRAGIARPCRPAVHGAVARVAFPALCFPCRPAAWGCDCPRLRASAAWRRFECIVMRITRAVKTQKTDFAWPVLRAGCVWLFAKKRGAGACGGVRPLSEIKSGRRIDRILRPNERMCDYLAARHASYCFWNSAVICSAPEAFSASRKMGRYCSGSSVPSDSRLPYSTTAAWHMAI